MTPHPQQPQTDPAPVTRAALQVLRARADERWVEISDRVLTRAMTVARRSPPVRAASSGGPVNVSEQVLVSGIRQALDDDHDARPLDILIQTDEDRRYTGVQITVAVRYRMPILPVADRMRGLAQDALTTLLGPISPPVTVTDMHVHVGDIDPDTSTTPITD